MRVVLLLPRVCAKMPVWYSQQSRCSPTSSSFYAMLFYIASERRGFRFCFVSVAFVHIALIFSRLGVKASEGIFVFIQGFWRLFIFTWWAFVWLSWLFSVLCHGLFVCLRPNCILSPLCKFFWMNRVIESATIIRRFEVIQIQILWFLRRFFSHLDPWPYVICFACAVRISLTIQWSITSRAQRRLGNIKSPLHFIIQNWSITKILFQFVCAKNVINCSGSLETR